MFYRQFGHQQNYRPTRLITPATLPRAAVFKLFSNSLPAGY
jgi:hypothetical protein